MDLSGPSIDVKLKERKKERSSPSSERQLQQLPFTLKDSSKVCTSRKICASRHPGALFDLLAEPLKGPFGSFLQPALLTYLFGCAV